MEVMLGQASEPPLSFSIVIETANLQYADHQRLIASLDSMAGQDPSPATADSVVILDAGEAPPEMLAMLRVRYPWITVERIPAGTDYGDQKAIAVKHATGEILVFADSDCLYESGWLAAFLRTFAERSDIDVLAGETAVAITGPFTLAMALVFFFPRFSYETEAAPARGFYGNNVAFRRNVFSRCPWPLGLPMYRAQNVIYSRLLHLAGIPIWREPRSRSVHSPPEGIRSALTRFLWSGRDSPRLASLGAPPPDAPFQGDYEPYDRPGGRVRKVFERVRSVCRQQPLMLFYLPVALPIAAGCVAMFFAGVRIERWKPAAFAGAVSAEPEDRYAASEPPR